MKAHKVLSYETNGLLLRGHKEGNMRWCRLESTAGIEVTIKIRKCFTYLPVYIGSIFGLVSNNDG